MNKIKYNIMGHEFKNENNQLILCGRALTVPLRVPNPSNKYAYGMLFEDGKSGAVLPLDLSSLDDYDVFIKPLDRLMIYGHIGDSQGQPSFMVEEIKANKNPEIYNTGFVFGKLYDAKKFVNIDGQSFLKIEITVPDYFAGTQENVAVYTQNENLINYLTRHGAKRGKPVAVKYFLTYNVGQQSFSFLPILMGFETMACLPNSVFNTYTPLSSEEMFEPKAKFPNNANYVTAVGIVKSLTEQIDENNWQATILLKRNEHSFELPIIMNEKTAQAFDEHNEIGDTTIVYGSLDQNDFGFTCIRLNSFTNLQKRFSDDYSSSFGHMVFQLEEASSTPRGIEKFKTKAPNINKNQFKIKINGTTYSSKTGRELAEQFKEAMNTPYASFYRGIYTFIPSQFDEQSIAQVLPKIVAAKPLTR